MQVMSLKKQVLLLEEKLNNSKDQYCRSLVSQGVPKEVAEGLAVKAQSKLQDHRLCKRIYKDYQELMAKNADLDACRYSE